MNARKTTAAVIAALLVIVTPAYALAQGPAAQTVIVQPGQQLLSQKTKPGLLESVGCSNDDFSSVYNHPDNKGKIGITCGGFDSNEALGEPTTNGNGTSFHYNKAVSCRNWVVEVRPNSVLTIPADCKPKMGQMITELQAVNEALKAQGASANGRADEAAKRADDNLSALERVSVMYHEVVNDLTRRVANLTFLTIVSFAFSVAGIVFMSLVLIRVLRQLKELSAKVSGTPNSELLIEEFRKGVIPAMSKELEDKLKLASAPILAEIATKAEGEQKAIAKERAKLEVRESQLKLMGDEIGKSTAELRNAQRQLAEDRGAFEGRKNTLLTTATREGYEAGEQYWLLERRKLADDRAVFEAEAAEDRERRLEQLAQINAKDEEAEKKARELDAREQDIEAREAELVRAASVMTATLDDGSRVRLAEESPSGPTTSPFPLAQTGGYPRNASPQEVTMPSPDGSRVVRATMPIGSSDRSSSSPPLIPRPSEPPKFPKGDLEGHISPSEWPKSVDGSAVTCTDMFELVEQTFRLADDGAKIVCNICDAGMDPGTHEQHNHFMCSVCQDCGVMDEIGLKVHIRDRHPELMTSHSDRPEGKDDASGHRVLPPKFEPVEDTELLECGYCFDQVEKDRIGDHVHVECTRCVPPKVLFASEIGTHDMEKHPVEKKDGA